MKPALFLANYFRFYLPIDVHIYSVVFILLKKMNTTTEEELKLNLDLIERNLTNSDGRLILDFATNFGRKQNFTSKFGSALMLIFLPFIPRKLTEEELQEMRRYFANPTDEEHYDLFKYFFPFEQAYTTKYYQHMKARAYYLTRKTVMKYGSKKKIIKVIRDDDQLKFFVADWFYTLATDQDITNKRVFIRMLDGLFRELVLFLTADKETQKEHFLSTVESYEFIVDRHFGEGIKFLDKHLEEKDGK